jgi:glycosyltransferase EpsE
VVVGRNESKTLPRLLDSVSHFMKAGGDFVYVDTGSTDGTPDVARAGGCRVFEEGPRFHYTCDAETAKAINDKFVAGDDPPIINEGDRFFAFDQARNYAMGLAKNDFICTPDCDEAWTVLNIDKLNKLIEEGYEKLMVDFVFAHFPDGKPAVEFCADTRLYDRRKIKWKGIVHETMQHQGDVKMGRVGRDVAFLEHFQNKETDRTRYLAGLAWACHEEPGNDRNSHYFARELMYRGRFRSAIKEFQRHIDMNAWPDERGQSMVYMGNCYEALGDEAMALRSWHEAFELTGNRREPLLCIAHYWKRKDKKLAVAAYAAAALQIPNNGFYANRVANYTFEPHALLYWAKGWTGDIPAAREHLLKCLEYHPAEATFLRDMQFYFSEDEIAEARKKAGLNGGAKKRPLVSILMPAYNVGQFIGKAIDSVRSQSLKDWELIITDDGSDDSTLDIAKGYADIDGRIKVFSFDKNQGYSKAFNECLSHATGRYIARMDADDWDNPIRLEKSVARLESEPLCDCVSCSIFYGEEGGERLITTEREGMVPEKYMDFACYGHGGAPVNATIVAKREVYDTVGGFDTSTNYGIDSDWDVRVNLAGFRWSYIDEPLYHYRKHGNQNVNKRTCQWYAQQQKGFLEKAKPLWTNPFNPHRHIEVLVTGKCNRNCRYCSQATYNENYKDYQTPIELIQKLCDRSKAIGARYEWIQFSGGEPFMWDNLEEACRLVKDSGAFKKVRVFSNCYHWDRMEKVLGDNLIDVVYTNSTNASPSGWKKLAKAFPDKSIVAPLEHKPLPTEPMAGVLPARCNCNHPCVVENNVYPCGNFYEHITRLGKNMDDYKDYFCSLDDDWIGFYRKVDRFNMDICSYCLANGRVWEKIPYEEKSNVLGGY